MANSRKLGPLGYSGEAEDLNDGTLIRTLSPRPGSTGSVPATTIASHRPSSPPSISPKRVRRTTAATTIQVLRQGGRGSEVQKLQRQLNVRLAPSPNLAVDGIFGPVTLQAVQQYQRGVSIAADGVVGKQTWYHLLKGDKATVLQAPITTLRPAVASPTSTIPQPPRATPPPAPPESIWEWPFEKKLLVVLERVPSRLPGRARDEFMALLQLENLALSLAIIAGFCLLSGGTVLVLGIVILGLDMTMSLAIAVQTAALAATEDELNEAADELAHIVLTVGVAAFIKGVGKIAKGVKGGGKGGAAEAPPKPAAKPTTSKLKTSPKPALSELPPKLQKPANVDAVPPPTTAPKSGSLTDVEARKWYHDQLDQIPKKIPAELPSEQQARLQIKLRNQAKRQARDLMADRAKAAELDRTDPIRSADYYIEKAKAKGHEENALWDYLKSSSQRSRPSVDKSLGLERKSQQGAQSSPLKKTSEGE